MVKITVGMIVLNGEPFISYNLRSLYPFAHQIIVIEGAAPGAAYSANSDGHSKDNTLEIIKTFQKNEDPDKKIILVTAEDEGYPNGFWPGEKDEQSQAYALRATGDYLWQVDVDEFYRKEDVIEIISMLEGDPEISGCSFPMLTFWGALNVVTDGWYLRRGAGYYHRLFRWKKEYAYATHRPPTVLDENGADLRNGHWISGETLKSKGIFLYHYSLLFPVQVLEKCEYYQRAQWARRSRAVEWFHDDFMKLKHPFRVHNVYDHPSWLEWYSGQHPVQAVNMIEDIKARILNVDLRDMGDAYSLLKSKTYSFGRYLVKKADYVNRLWVKVFSIIKFPFRIAKKTMRILINEKNRELNHEIKS